MKNRYHDQSVGFTGSAAKSTFSNLSNRFPKLRGGAKTS